jgi:uncharacterized protein (TIGR02186 family)
MRRATLALLLALMAAPAGAEKLASTVSTSSVQITSSFDGTILSLFGTIEPDQPGTALIGHYNVVIVITGPLQDRVARLKTNSFGIWTNTEQEVFHQFPSFYQVISSGQLETIAGDDVLSGTGVLPEQLAAAAAKTPGEKADLFGAELIRLMTQQGHFGVDERGVRFLSPTAYTAQVILPSDVPNGTFLAHTLVLKDGAIVAERGEGFSVHKTGFENFVFAASRQQPLLYGLVCVVLAIGTGWLAGVVFRR